MKSFKTVLRRIKRQMESHAQKPKPTSQEVVDHKRRMKRLYSQLNETRDIMRDIGLLRYNTNPRNHGNGHK